MPSPQVTVVVPTLHAGEPLDRCLDALTRQSFDGFETIVVDNSGSGAAADAAKRPRVRVIANRENVGFGAAINQGIELAKQFRVTIVSDSFPETELPASLRFVVVNPLRFDYLRRLCHVPNEYSFIRSTMRAVSRIHRSDPLAVADMQIKSWEFKLLCSLLH